MASVNSLMNCIEGGSVSMNNRIHGFSNSVDYNAFSNSLSTCVLFITILSFIVYLITLSNKSYRKNPIPSINCSIYGCTWIFIDLLMCVRKGHINNALHVCLRSMNGLLHLYKKEGIFQFRTLLKSTVIFYKPETVEVLLKSTVNIDKTIPYSFLHEWLGTGLITSTGQKWHYRRKLITPSFHFRILKELMPIFNKQSDIFVTKLRCQQSAWTNIVPMSISATLDIISEAAMGVSMNAQSNESQDLSNSIYKLGAIGLLRLSKPWLIPNSLFHLSSVGKKYSKHLDTVNSVAKKVIKDKKEELKRRKADHSISMNEKNEINPGAFLESLLEVHIKDPSFTLDDILEEVNTFMFAGHDTGAMTIAFSLYCLGLEENRHIQAKVHEELDNIFHGDFNREITWDDITNMKYLECVIKETLRLYPTVPIVTRNSATNFDVGRYTVEKGIMCIINIYMLHRDPLSYPDPEKYDPERFFPENMKGRHHYAYIPFSAGLRNCIGQKFAFAEVKAVLANILRNFKVESRDPRDKINIFSNIILKSLEPMMLRFTSRL